MWEGVNIAAYWKSQVTSSILHTGHLEPQELSNVPPATQPGDMAALGASKHFLNVCFDSGAILRQKCHLASFFWYIAD